MKLFFKAASIVALVSMMTTLGRAAGDAESEAVVDKAIKAMGGAEKLGAIKAATWKSKGKITVGGGDNEFTAQSTFHGLDHYRSEFEGDFGGNTIKGVTVLAGDKGWRKFGDMGMPLDKAGVANEKRTVYLQVVPSILVPLKGKEFKIALAGTEQVAGKPAVALKVTGPDGKDFKLYFDKESGLPVKQVASVIGFMGEEFEQESSYSKFKDFGGVQRATHVEVKRDGETFIIVDVTEYRTLEKVDAKTFTEPE